MPRRSEPNPRRMGPCRGETNKCPAGQGPSSIKGDGRVPGGNEQMPPTPEPAPKREGPRVGGGLTQMTFESSGRRHGPPTLQATEDGRELERLENEKRQKRLARKRGWRKTSAQKPKLNWPKNVDFKKTENIKMGALPKTFFTPGRGGIHDRSIRFRVLHWQRSPLGALNRLKSRRGCTPKTGSPVRGLRDLSLGQKAG